MKLLDFAGKHPIVTVIGLFVAGSTVVEVVRLVRGPTAPRDLPPKRPIDEPGVPIINLSDRIR